MNKAPARYNVTRIAEKHLLRCCHILWKRLQFYDEYLDRKIVPLDAPWEADLQKLLSGKSIGYIANELIREGTSDTVEIQGFVIAEPKKQYMKVLYLEAIPDKAKDAIPYLLSTLERFLDVNKGIVVEVEPGETAKLAILEAGGYKHVDDVEKDGVITRLVFSKSSP